MKLKRFTLVIPIMALVLVLAIWMLNKDYSEIESGTRFMIAAGAALFSGLISFFLFPENEEKKPSKK
ncbi:histidine kinase [Bacillus nitroreducens]